MADVNTQVESTDARSLPLPMAVIVHLSGSRRGTTERLNSDVIRIGTDPDTEVHLPADKEGEVVAPHHAVVRREGEGWRIIAEPGESVEVNGTKTSEVRLVSGDILQIGEYGPLLRFRVYRGGDDAYKSMLEAFADCVDCARHGGGNFVERTFILMGGIPSELSRQTRPRTRIMLALLVVAFIGLIGLAVHSRNLEKRLASEQLKVRGLAEMLEKTESRMPTRDELEALRSRIAMDLEGATSRVEALEAGADAPRRLLLEYSRSVVFLQGAYAFHEPSSMKPLRFAGMGPDGKPIRGPDGSPLIVVEGDGPIIESMFTGTAFVATEKGLLITNRHVAIPWEADPSTEFMVKQGLVPKMTRFVGYVSGVPKGFDVSLVRASDDADLAVLECGEMINELTPIPLAEIAPVPGEGILVMGFPTGIRAVIARADESFVDSLMEDDDIDFWTIAARLSEEGHISPLASRGIVGQVNDTMVAYDAETTSGGSGGPAINFHGEVVAVNTAILPEFGGSNLGVPAALARALLVQVEEDLVKRFSELTN